MFSIGMFSSHLPLILMALIYGASLGIHTVMGTNIPEIPTDPAGEAEWIVPSQELHPDMCKKDFHYGQQVAGEQNLSERNNRTGIPIRFHCRDEIVSTLHITCTLFSRPPPVA